MIEAAWHTAGRCAAAASVRDSCSSTADRVQLCCIAASWPRTYSVVAVHASRLELCSVEHRPEASHVGCPGRSPQGHRRCRGLCAKLHQRQLVAGQRALRQRTQDRLQAALAYLLPVGLQGSCGLHVDAWVTRVCCSACCSAQPAQLAHLQEDTEPASGTELVCHAAGVAFAPKLKLRSVQAMLHRCDCHAMPCACVMPKPRLFSSPQIYSFLRQACEPCCCATCKVQLCSSAELG